MPFTRRWCTCSAGIMTNEKNNAARVSDLTVALVVVLLCLYAGFASYSLEPATRFFPLFIILSLLVIVLGHLALVIADLARQRWRSGQVSNTVAHIGVRAHLFPLAAAAIAFLYALSLEPVGYELSSFVFLL